MGTLTLPSSGVVYVDTAPIIYSVEKNPQFAALLDPLWEAVEAGANELVSSQLILLETLVVPIRNQDSLLVQRYEELLTASEMRLIPISENILREAARWRAAVNLKTPDAIHAASALSVGCAQFITNDAAFRRVPGLNVVVLQELT